MALIIGANIRGGRASTGYYRERAGDEKHLEFNQYRQDSQRTKRIRNKCARLCNSYDSNDVIVRISPCRGIDEKVANLVGLGPELELVVRGFSALKSIVEDFLNGLTKRGDDECGNKRLIPGFLFGIACNLGGLIVPLIDISL